MRKALLLLVALALIAGGAYLFEQTLSHPNFYTILRTAGMAVIFIALGAYLLWDDFVKPRWRRTRRQARASMHGGVHDHRHGCPRQERHRKEDDEAEVTHGAAYRRHARAASSAAIHSLERWMAMASL